LAGAEKGWLYWLIVCLYNGRGFFIYSPR
jgi:hypothetical protein